MNFEETPIPAQNTPRPFKEIPGLWLRFIQMTEAFFTNELPHASIQNTVISVMSYTGISTVLIVIQSLLGNLFNLTPLSSAMDPTQAASFARSITIFLCCFTIIGTPLSFYLNSGITYVSALIFGGKGKFTSQAYLTSLFFVPLGLISSLVSLISTLIPTGGNYILGIMTTAVILFHLRLLTRCLKAVHGFTTIRAIVAAVSPIILILIPLCMVAILAMMGPAVGSVFSTLNSSLGTTTP